MARVRTAVLVTFFTLLIWALAEGESLQTKRTVVDVEFPRTVTEAYTVRVADTSTWRGRVEVQVEGPTASLDGLESVLSQAIVLTPGIDGLPRESGEHTVDLRQALRGLAEFRTRGVTVLSAEPATVRVVVEELTTRQMEIRVEAPAEELDGPAQVVGADRAQVRMPVRVAAGLGDAAVVVARVRREDLVTLQEGVRSTLPVRLEPGPGYDGGQILGIDPAQVTVQVTVRSKTETIVLPSVAVDLRLPPGEVGGWEIEIPLEDQSLRDVKVTGPSGLIAQIRSGALVVRAFVRLSFEDLEAGVSSKRAEFSGFPSPLSFEVEDGEVKLAIRRRAGAGGASPG